MVARGATVLSCQLRWLHTARGSDRGLSRRGLPLSEGWESWRLVDPTTIEVTYWAGLEKCEGVHVDVVETERDVTINLSTGSLPGVTKCEAVAVAAATRVTLKKELGDREVRQDAES